MNKYKKAIEEIFGYVEQYSENSKQQSLEFIVDEFTAEKLFALSDLLNTGTILSRGASSSGCPTCGIDNQIRIEASNVKF